MCITPSQVLCQRNTYLVLRQQKTIGILSNTRWGFATRPVLMEWGAGESSRLFNLNGNRKLLQTSEHFLWGQTRVSIRTRRLAQRKVSSDVCLPTIRAHIDDWIKRMKFPYFCRTKGEPAGASLYERKTMYTRFSGAQWGLFQSCPCGTCASNLQGLTLTGLSQNLWTERIQK